MKGKYLNISLVVLLFMLMVSVSYWDFSDVVSLSINDVLLIGLFIFSIRLTFYESAKGQYILLAFIVLALPGIITTNFNINGSGSSMTVGYFGSFKFNPLSFLLLVFYLLINRKNVLAAIGRARYGSEQERIDKVNREISFYYDKFNSCNSDELNDIFKSFNDYPPEAKTALRKINEERNLSLLNI